MSNPSEMTPSVELCGYKVKKWRDWFDYAPSELCRCGHTYEHHKDGHCTICAGRCDRDYDDGGKSRTALEAAPMTNNDQTNSNSTLEHMHCFCGHVQATSYYPGRTYVDSLCCKCGMTCSQWLTEAALKDAGKEISSDSPI